MKPELSQKEFQNFVNEGRTSIWQYNTLYQIEYSRNLGKGEYYLRPVTKLSMKGESVTARGRFHAMTPERAASFL